MTHDSIKCLGIYYSSSGLIAQIRLDQHVGIWDQSGVEYLIQESADRPERLGVLTQILDHLKHPYSSTCVLKTDDLIGQTSLLSSS